MFRRYNLSNPEMIVNEWQLQGMLLTRTPQLLFPSHGSLWIAFADPWIARKCQTSISVVLDWNWSLALPCNPWIAASNKTQSRHWEELLNPECGIRKQVKKNKLGTKVCLPHSCHPPTTISRLLPFCHLNQQEPANAVTLGLALSHFRRGPQTVNNALLKAKVAASAYVP